MLDKISFKPVYTTQFEHRLPESHHLLMDTLILHKVVRQVCLTGSRGLASGYRPDSDIDLSLIIQPEGQLEQDDLADLCQQVLTVSLENWSGEVELDTAVIFDTRGCGLKCLSVETAEANTCQIGGVDCFGLYKIQRGFSGFVENAGIEVNKIYPNMVIFKW